jgi:hypothetical protein
MSTTGRENMRLPSWPHRAGRTKRVYCGLDWGRWACTDQIEAMQNAQQFAMQLMSNFCAQLIVGMDETHQRWRAPTANVATAAWSLQWLQPCAA